MRSRSLLPLTFFACVASGLPQTAGTAVDYGRDVRPILSENCFQCHGQDVTKRMAGLGLDSFEAATANRNGHIALVPGKPEDSLIYKRITAAAGAGHMPPAASNKSLTQAQIATLRRWIEQGGRYTQHWSFIPPVRPTVPLSGDRWLKQPLDAFILQRLRAENLKPTVAATPAAWLRRVSLDLTGLPPSPAEVDSFSLAVSKRGEAAYAATADRLLASPAYGERMAIDWLDVARYADTHGFNNDAERDMWRWRDWVIEAFNRNLPYNRFITEQLAGDLLPKPTLDQRIATGFGRNHVINSEGGIIEEEYRVEYVTDRVRTLGMAWLGLTLECAHCHNHKFDPITQRDHYRFFAFFNNIAELGEDGRVANAVPMMPAPTPAQQQKMRELEVRIAKLERAKAPKVVDSPPPPVPEGGIAITAETKLPVSKREPRTYTLWVNPTDTDTDAPLLSAIDYSKNPASVGYGGGIELRLVQGELEFRFSQRFPNYSLRVRSEGAGIRAGKPTHLALVYEGAAPTSERAYAAWVRIFANGSELATRVLNDGLTLPGATDKPAQTTFRLGLDNAPTPHRYLGTLETPQAWDRVLLPSQIATLARTTVSPELEALRSELFALRRHAPTVMVMQELATPRQTHLLVRGSYDVPGEPVDAGVPEALLGAWPAGAPRNRLGLAQWLTKPDHPLTARVVVNRFWQQLFGNGLVKTSDNFGLQGESPSHPELLDYLARDFVDSGWNVKALMKRIVLSATYRQASAAPPELIAKDPENRLLARGPRFRLPAEIIRDQALQVAGLLKQVVGGPSVFPYQPKDLYKGIVVAATYPGTTWTESKGDDLYRRSIYTWWKRTVPHPTMNVFDAPDREVCIVKRTTTNTPLQALTLLNDPIFVEAARRLAERVIKEGGATPESRLAFAFRLATGHVPNQAEARILASSLAQMQRVFQADPAAAKALLQVGASRPDPALAEAELAAWTALMNVILNMDEVITKN